MCEQCVIRGTGKLVQKYCDSNPSRSGQGICIKVKPAKCEPCKQIYFPETGECKPCPQDHVCGEMEKRGNNGQLLNRGPCRNQQFCKRFVSWEREMTAANSLTVIEKHAVVVGTCQGKPLTCQPNPQPDPQKCCNALTTLFNGQPSCTQCVYHFDRSGLA